MQDIHHTVEFIDTHSHLYDEAFTSEEDLAVSRALEAGVTKMILPDILPNVQLHLPMLEFHLLKD